MAYASVMHPVAPTAVVNNTMTTALPDATTGLGSLVFDFEVEEHTPNSRVVLAPGRSKEKLSHDKEKMLHFSSPDTSYSAKLLRDVRYFVYEERDPDAILLATKLSAVGYCVNVRTALGGGASCFRNLRHEFLTVRGHGDFEGVEFIVEPRFREHFLISHPTQEYSELLSHAPDVFVGVGGRLVPIVQTLCDAMADSFDRKNLTIPPWRRTQSMLSKWLPNRLRDVSFSRGSAPPQHVPDRHRPAAAFSPSQAHAAISTAASPSAGPFTRISDPLFARANTHKPQPVANMLQQQRVDARDAAVQHGPDCGDVWAYATQGFIPFGGAGGCSSDTEEPSPPAAGVATSGPMGQSGQRGAAATTAATAAVACPSLRRAAQSSLLASHLQPPRPAPAGAAVVQGPTSSAHQHHPSGVLQTLPPVHWGEAPIHRIRMGFQVAASPTGQRAPVQEQELEQSQQEPVPEHPAPRLRP